MSIKSIYGFQAPPAQYQQSQGISVCDNQFFEVWNLVGDLDSISTEPAINIYLYVYGGDQNSIYLSFRDKNLMGYY